MKEGPPPSKVIGNHDGGGNGVEMVMKRAIFLKRMSENWTILEIAKIKSLSMDKLL